MFLSLLRYAFPPVLLFFVYITFQRKLKCRPPGPRGLPLLGNIFDMPTGNEWKTFYDWSCKYGDIMYLEILGQPIVILNTLETATELLSERSSIYSNRPTLPLLEFIGHLTFNFAFMPYGNEWQARRRVFTRQYRRGHLSKFQDAYAEASLIMLQAFHKNPNDYRSNFQLFTTKLMLDITYGLEINSLDHELAKVVHDVLATVSLGVSPIMFFFNPLPLVRVLPDRLQQLCNISSYIETWRKDLQKLLITPFKLSKAEMSKGFAKKSFTTDLLQDLDPGQEVTVQETLIRDAAATAFGGGADTIQSACSTFLLAMALHQYVQTQAQQEIDNVVGRNRLPDLSDRPRLPFVSAIAKEVLRWHPPAPQGVPHALQKDDYYRGYQIPAGSIVIGNIWKILHDPLIFEEPLQFKPERFLGLSNERYEMLDANLRVAFGFGRRVCPGIILAEDTIWLVVAQFLAVYSISPVSGLPLHPAFTSGAISQPELFKYNLAIRSEEVVRLLLPDS